MLPHLFTQIKMQDNYVLGSATLDTNNAHIDRELNRHRAETQPERTASGCFDAKCLNAPDPHSGFKKYNNDAAGTEGRQGFDLCFVDEMMWDDKDQRSVPTGKTTVPSGEQYWNSCCGYKEFGVMRGMLEVRLDLKLNINQEDRLVIGDY